MTSKTQQKFVKLSILLGAFPFVALFGVVWLNEEIAIKLFVGGLVVFLWYMLVMLFLQIKNNFSKDVNRKNLNGGSERKSPLYSEFGVVILLVILGCSLLITIWSILLFVNNR